MPALLRRGQTASASRASRARGSSATTGAASGAGARDSGVTLVEVIVALGIVLVLLTAAASAFIGALNGQRTAEATDQATQLANDQVQRMRQVPWAAVSLDPGAQRTGTCTDPLEVVAVQRICRTNDFTVTTAVTWAGTGATITPASAPQTYDAKRITVTVTWSQGQRTRTLTSGALRAPTLAERIPPGFTGTAVNACNLPAPDSGPVLFCRLWVTHGQVLAAGSPLTVARPITMRAVTTERATAVAVQVPGLGTLDLDGDASGTTWTTTIIPGTAFTGAVSPLEAAPFVFTGVPATGGSVDATYTAAKWRLALPVSAEMSLRPVTGTWDQVPRLLTATGGQPISGTEATSARVCVDAAGKTWVDQALAFEVVNIDDIDGDQGDVSRGIGGTAHPVATLTGVVDPGTGQVTTLVLAAADITHPRESDPGAVPPYEGSPDGVEGGYVGAAASTPGSLNTLRYAATMRGGTALRADGAPLPAAVSLTLRATRPADGLSITQSVRLPVTQTTSAAACVDGGA